MTFLLLHTDYSDSSVFDKYHLYLTEFQWHWSFWQSTTLQGSHHCQTYNHFRRKHSIYLRLDIDSKLIDIYLHLNSGSRKQFLLAKTKVLKTFNTLWNQTSPVIHRGHSISSDCQYLLLRIEILSSLSANPQSKRYNWSPTTTLISVIQNRFCARKCRQAHSYSVLLVALSMHPLTHRQIRRSFQIHRQHGVQLLVPLIVDQILNYRRGQLLTLSMKINYKIKPNKPKQLKN